jgi:hypothetical protein
MIRELLALADRRGSKGLVGPVRPSLKALHARVAIDDYITWTDQRGGGRRIPGCPAISRRAGD